MSKGNLKYNHNMCWVIISLITLITGAFFSTNHYSVIFTSIIWLILALNNLQKKESSDNNALSLSNSSALRGIAAIEIMLGHIGIETNNLVQFPNRKAGILFVGLFFLISGYGLAYGYHNKDRYLDNFFSSRLPKILSPAVLAFFCNSIILHSINTYILLKGAYWYVCELLILYLVFFITFKFFKKPLHILLIASVILVLGAYAIGLDNPWYGSTLCFPLGFYYYEYRDKISQLKGKNKIPCLVILFLVLCLSILGFFVIENTFIANVISRTLASTSFCIILLIILRDYNIGNVFSHWLGDISYEIYLVHPLVISLVNRYHISSDYWYTITVIAITIVISKIFHMLFCKILKRK